VKGRGQVAGTFFNFFVDVVISGTNVAFTGFFSKGFKNGVCVATPHSPPVKVADNTTPVPGGFGNFLAFGNISIDPGDVVFEGYSEDASSHVVKGIYSNVGGTLFKIIDTNDTPGGNALSGVNMGYDAFSGNQVAFEVDYASGEQGIYVATLGGNRCPLSQGFWKNHQSVWPETSLTLGSQNYTAAELLAILNTSSNSDASLILARQLIAAKLNIFNGSNAAPRARPLPMPTGCLADSRASCRTA